MSASPALAPLHPKSNPISFKQNVEWSNPVRGTCGNLLSEQEPALQREMLVWAAFSANVSDKLWIIHSFRKFRKKSAYVSFPMKAVIDNPKILPTALNKWEFPFTAHSSCFIWTVQNCFNDLLALNDQKTHTWLICCRWHCCVLHVLHTSSPRFPTSAAAKIPRIPGLACREGWMQQVVVRVRSTFPFIAHIGSVSVCVFRLSSGCSPGRRARQEIQSSCCRFNHWPSRNGTDCYSI